MILITRPIDQAKRTYTKLANFGFQSVIYPFSELNEYNSEQIENIIYDNYDYIIVTSQIAAQKIANISKLSNKSFYIVGQKSGEILKAANQNVISISSNSKKLLKEITQNISVDKRLLYLSGEHKGFDFVKELKDLGYVIHNIPIYKMDYINEIEENVFKNITTVLLYSPKAAEAFAKIARFPVNNLIVICISENCALKIKHLPFKRVLVAAEPNEEGIISCLK